MWDPVLQAVLYAQFCCEPKHCSTKIKSVNNNNNNKNISGKCERANNFSFSGNEKQVTQQEVTAQKLGDTQE